MFEVKRFSDSGGNPKYMETSINYIYSVTGMNADTLSRIANENLTEPGGRAVITTYEKIFRKGKREGKEEGRAEGIFEGYEFYLRDKFGSVDRTILSALRKSFQKSGQAEVEAVLRSASSIGELKKLLSGL
ncbi:MAG: hypothetical protein NUW37_01455 [Planctomycetes bacterium]|nr:hypothetical protein [Planctomycetota bacterium]